MMKNNKGFTLIELLAVIVVLAIVMVLAVTTVLPYMSSARENAFGVEATAVVKAAQNAKDLVTLGQIPITNSADACKSSTKMCFTVSQLISLGLYEADTSVYSGSITISNYSTTTPTYTLNLNKSDEFKIIGGTTMDYTKSIPSTNVTWVAATHAKCSCS